jgi:hypothetical protein
MTLTDSVIQSVIRRLVNGQDYRVEIVALIDAQFLEYVVDFFRRVVEAKLKNQSVTVDWYKREFLDPRLPSDELTINAGLNKKTISNMYNSARREIVLEATAEHYEQLYKTVNRLIEEGGDLDITLTIKFRGVSVDLNINESLIVINTLAVKRAELRGGAWSTAGKQVEKTLMITLCRLFGVPTENYYHTGLTDEQREIDFYLIGADRQKYRCEVKLMGKGNPESADAIIARDSAVFIADKLSDLNKRQLTSRKVEWVELRQVNGYHKFYEILRRLKVPCRDFTGDLSECLDKVLAAIA